MTDSEPNNLPGELSTDAEGKLEFPCRYPVKAMTRTDDPVMGEVLSVITDLGLQYDADSVRARPSRNGRFQSITVLVSVASRSELEQVYSRLRALDCVLMTL